MKKENPNTVYVNLLVKKLLTPLTSIKAYADTLYSIDELTIKEKKDFARVISLEADRLTGIINDIVFLNKSEQGTFHYYKKESSINDVINNYCVLIKEKFSEKNIKFETNFKENLPLISIDTDRITQVFINILNNAIKFTEPGGTVSIKTGLTGNHIRISVADTGKGISDKDKSKIFEPFQYADKQDQAIGTGLGLSISRTIIEKGHNGKIEVESEVGSGSVFHILLPISKSTE